MFRIIDNFLELSNARLVNSLNIGLTRRHLLDRVSIMRTYELFHSTIDVLERIVEEHRNHPAILDQVEYELDFRRRTPRVQALQMDLAKRLAGFVPTELESLADDSIIDLSTYLSEVRPDLASLFRTADHSLVDSVRARNNDVIALCTTLLDEIIGTHAAMAFVPSRDLARNTTGIRHVAQYLAHMQHRTDATGALDESRNTMTAAAPIACPRCRRAASAWPPVSSRPQRVDASC